MKQYFFIISIVCAVGFFRSEMTISQEFAGRPLNGDSVVIGALDKITGRVQEFPLRVGDVGKFYSLHIHVLKCQFNPPEKRPENSAFLKIFEDSEDKGFDKKIFQGWMFSSSPALSAIDHPVYDVWVVKCNKD